LETLPFPFAERAGTLTLVDDLLECWASQRVLCAESFLELKDLAKAMNVQSFIRRTRNKKQEQGTK